MSHLAARWQRPEVLEAIFDQLSDALFIYDKDLRIAGVNQSAQRLFGMPAEELIGKHCQELFHCTGCESACAMLQGLGDAPCVPSGTVSLHVENGHERLVVIRTVQLRDDAGALEGVVATVKDITEEAEPGRRQIIAESQAMREVLNFVRRVAVSEAASILIEGENGTGKDLIAKTLHYQSLRQAEPFLAINCAAIPETLLESELFGYEKGAFTDARSQKRGLFELADKGTLFLDEIGDLPVDLQAKLLRALQEREIKPVGSNERVSIEVRVIAATNRDLEDAIRKNQFRQDLFFRLNVVQIKLPPLRERKNDIPMLVNSFLEKFSPAERPVTGISEEAMGRLMAYDWPGNVRELENAVERAVALGSGQVLTLTDLPTNLQHGIFERRMGMDELVPLEELERRAIFRALRETGGDKLAAARLLGIGKTTLYRKLKEYEHLKASQN